MKWYKIFTPTTIVKLISYWPPLFFSGISVREFDLEKCYVRARLKTRFFNKNYFGTHYGGSLYSLCDPFFAFIFLHHLGKDFIIWDKAAKIDFIAATKDPVYAYFSISKEEIARVRKEAQKKSKVEPVYQVDITDIEGKIIARVEKTLYIRKKCR